MQEPVEGPEEVSGQQGTDSGPGLYPSPDGLNVHTCLCHLAKGLRLHQ